MGGYHDFLWKFTCRALPKTFKGESFSVSMISGIEKIRDKRMRGNNDFPAKLICLARLKDFVEEPFCAVCPNAFGSQKLCR